MLRPTRGHPDTDPPALSGKPKGKRVKEESDCIDRKLQNLRSTGDSSLRGDAGYRDSQLDDREVDEVYQDEDMGTSFHIDHGLGLDSLVGDRGDVIGPDKRKRQPIRKKVTYRPSGRKRQLNREADEF